jgi:tetratricopeptide (TPR) repeat protein
MLALCHLRNFWLVLNRFFLNQLEFFMLEIRLFGVPQVRLGKRWVEVKANRMGALLLYLAQRQMPVSREQIASLFWGDSSQSLARNSLRQLLARLRHSEFSKAIVAEGEHLRFVGRVAATQNGGLLEGFVLSQCPDFMVWLESARLAVRAPKRQLPQYEVPFVGRENEVQSLRHLCNNQRLVTVLGLGGVGKTRLCLQVLGEGARFVALENARPEDLGYLLLEAQNMVVRHNLEMIEQCVAAYHGFNGLLFLDNFETVQSQANSLLLVTLLERCAGLRLLVSSREALGIHAETIFSLEGFASLTEAINFFLATAKALYPKWQPQPQDEPALYEVAHLTSAMPLALELAAVWLKNTSVMEVAARLPKTGLRLAQLDKVLHATWTRQSTKVQQILRRVAVFRAGCSLAALKSVGQLELSHLQHLMPVLLRRDHDGRYAMPEVLRQWVLATAPDQAAKTAHAMFYAKFAQDIAPVFWGTGSRVALGHFRADLENLRLAWETLKQSENDELLTLRDEMLSTMRDGMFLGLQMMGLAQEGYQRFVACSKPDFQSRAAAFLVQQGKFAEARDIALLALNHRTDPSERAVAQTVLGEALTKLGEYTAARVHLEQALRHATTFWRAIALDAQGTILADVDGDYAAGNDLMLQALRLRHTLGDQRGVARSQISLGVSYYLLGEHQTAKQFWLEALTAMRELGDVIGQGKCLSNLGVVLDDLGEHEAARHHLEQALEMRSAVGDHSGAAQALLNLGLHELERQHNSQKARVLFHESLHIRQRLGEQRAIIGSQIALADVRLYPEDLPQAEQHAQSALSQSMAIGAVPLVHLAQIYLARVRIAQNRLSEAVQLLVEPLRDPTANAENRSKAQKVLEEIKLPMAAIEADQKRF